MSISNTPAAALPFEFGGFTIPAGTRRIFITAELESSNGDPRIQPTGFPDIGPVLYPDPAEKDGLICLIESEASMANRLEEVCFSNKYEGTLKDVFAGLPYLKAATEAGELKTTSTLDGHRFASDFLAKCKADFGAGEKTLAKHIKDMLRMSEDGKIMPIANVPDMFALVLSLDAMSLIHGFQISNEQISFVGLRMPRALSASIVGLGCERITVPGIKFNVGKVESESGQAIFQKQRITAKTIEARFSIDVGLLSSIRLVAPSEKVPEEKTEQLQAARAQLLLAIALWKVAAFLDLLSVEMSLRTECKLRLKHGKDIAPKYSCEGGSNASSASFPFAAIAAASLAGDQGLVSKASLPAGRSPLTLQFA